MRFFNILFPVLLFQPALAEDMLIPAISTSSVLPTYIALAPNINDFNRFADGGSDANWYIGYNNAWIVKLPPAPVGDYDRAFIGAKIGRAKTRPNPNRPRLREVIHGKIYMGISQTPTFSAEQSYFLAETADIPLEGDPQAYVDGVGSAEWFWTEVPLAAISFTGPNYLSAWSPSEYFLRSSSSPILAASTVEEEPLAKPRAWFNHSISGVPPRDEAQDPGRPLKNIAPALVIKLVPSRKTEVRISDFSMIKRGKKTLVQFSARGENIAESWVESSRDQLDWERISRILRRQPFIFTLAQDKIPASGGFIRGAARDLSGNVGFSAPYAISYEPH